MGREKSILLLLSFVNFFNDEIFWPFICVILLKHSTVYKPALSSFLQNSTVLLVILFVDRVQKLTPISLGSCGIQMKFLYPAISSSKLIMQIIIFFFTQSRMTGRDKGPRNQILGGLGLCLHSLRNCLCHHPCGSNPEH